MPIKAYFGDEIPECKCYKVVLMDDDDNEIHLYIKKKVLDKMIEDEYIS